MDDRIQILRFNIIFCDFKWENIIVLVKVNFAKTCRFFVPDNQEIIGKFPGIL